MNNPRIFLLLTIFLFLTSCEAEINVYLDDPEQAGNTAADYMEQFFIKKNSKNAISYMHEEFIKMVPEPDLQKMIDSTKSVPAIKRIEAISFVVNSEEKGNIAVYLMATRVDDVKAFLTIFTNGDSIEGYKVLGFETMGDTRNPDDLPGETYKERDIKIVRGI